MKQIKFAKTHESAVIPQYQYPGDSGMDITAPETHIIAPGETKLIPLYLKVELPVIAPPFQAELQVRPRSGLSQHSKLRIANTPGTVDFGYRGELGVLVENTGAEPYTLTAGTRFAQFVLCPVIHANVLGVPEGTLSVTRRAQHGFGSTDSSDHTPVAA